MPILKYYWKCAVFCVRTWIMEFAISVGCGGLFVEAVKKFLAFI